MAAIHDWNCQESAGGTTLADAVGGNTATISTGTIATTTGQGARPSAISFDGTPHYTHTAVSAANSADYSTLVFYKSNSAGTARLLGIPGSATVFLQVSSTTNIAVKGSGTSALNFTVPTLDTNWHSILVVHRASDDAVRVFLDGVESSTGPQTGNIGFAFSAIGRNNDTNFSGAIATVRHYNSDESANAAAIHAALLVAAIACKANHYRQLRNNNA